ncbi:MAG: cytochrome b [Gammaproteobacteria bacterium]|nr:cytochrome b [Gammaproteobacteria bacterium]
MQYRNTAERYGFIAMLLHWGLAILIIAMFALGSYMVELDYYDPWYKKAPDLHRSIGVIITGLMIYRLFWRLSNPRPRESGETWQRRLASWMHRLFYLLIAAIVISGYLITTADGQPVVVFHLFQIPAVFSGFGNQEDIAGEIHEWLTAILIVLVSLHALAALKHHFINRDSTLRRMLGKAD